MSRHRAARMKRWPTFVKPSCPVSGCATSSPPRTATTSGCSCTTTVGARSWCTTPTIPTACSSLVSLSPQTPEPCPNSSARAGSPKRSAAVQQEIEGLAIEWIELTPESPRRSDDRRRHVPTKTGSSIVAVIREGESIPAPGPSSSARRDVDRGGRHRRGSRRDARADPALTRRTPMLIAAGSSRRRTRVRRDRRVHPRASRSCRGVAGRFGITASRSTWSPAWRLGEGGVVQLDVTSILRDRRGDRRAAAAVRARPRVSESELRDGLKTGTRPASSTWCSTPPRASRSGSSSAGTTGCRPARRRTWIRSSGVVSKVLSDLGRLGFRETPAVLNLLVIEDLAMAMYLRWSRR